MACFLPPFRRGGRGGESTISINPTLIDASFLISHLRSIFDFVDTNLRPLLVRLTGHREVQAIRFRSE